MNYMMVLRSYRPPTGNAYIMRDTVVTGDDLPTAKPPGPLTVKTLFNLPGGITDAWWRFSLDLRWRLLLFGWMYAICFKCPWFGHRQWTYMLTWLTSGAKRLRLLRCSSDGRTWLIPRDVEHHPHTRWVRQVALADEARDSLNRH